MLITSEMIEQARIKGACDEALEWLESKPRAFEELCTERPDWSLWAVGHGIIELTPERLDACASERPWEALRFASERLTPERLDACASRAPGAALQFASERLPPERLDACASRVPGAALQFASEILSLERKAWCEEQTR